MTQHSSQITLRLEPHLGFGRAGFERHEVDQITLECPNMVLKLEDVYESVGLL
jgi:hypothetical protein